MKNPSTTISTLLLISAFIITNALTGCVATLTKQVDEAMASWMGHNANELIADANWGPPTNIISDGQGGRIFVYDRTTTRQGIGLSSTIALSGGRYSTVDMPGSIYKDVRSRTFWVNAQNIIYRTSWQGL